MATTERIIGASGGVRIRCAAWRPTERRINGEGVHATNQLVARIYGIH